MKLTPRNVAAIFAACLMSVAVFAADPSGTWKWSVPSRGGGNPREQTLTLAMKDGKLTGQLASPGRDGATMTADISNASIKDDVVSFVVEREFGGNKFVTKYSGKLSGDTITGESEFPGRDGDAIKREWVAKKAK